MTDEELEKTLREICVSLDSLPELKEPLPKKERIHRRTLELRKGYLERARDARKKNDAPDERYSLSAYSLITSWGEKHPFFVDYLLKHRFNRRAFL